MLQIDDFTRVPRLTPGTAYARWVLGGSRAAGDGDGMWNYWLTLWLLVYLTYHLVSLGMRQTKGGLGWR